MVHEQSDCASRSCMKRIPIPPAHDLVRFPASSAEDMAKAYRRWLLGGPAAFSNDPARKAARFALTRELPLDLLLRSVRQASRPLGREANAEIIESIWSYHVARQISTHEAPHWRFDFLAGFGVKIAANLLAVEDGKASMFWLQTRRRAAPSLKQLGMLQRLFLLKVRDSDYENVGLTILDVGQLIEGGGRIVKQYMIGDLPMPTEDEARVMLQTFADAHAILLAENFAEARAEHRAKRRPLTAGQNDLFT
jgi:hypothetical protein